MYKQILLSRSEIALLTTIIDRYLQDTGHKDSNAHIIKRTLNGHESHKSNTIENK
tara:strand:- start:812 stop:976 length:165 start_codon:yes stop_codon:yes gene_type:complete